jgi:hypothetical protein
VQQLLVAHVAESPRWQLQLPPLRKVANARQGQLLH